MCLINFIISNDQKGGNFLENKIPLLDDDLIGNYLKISGLTTFNLTSVQGAVIYFSVLPFCVGIWLFLGESLQGWLRKNSTIERIVYIILGLSMVASLLLA